MDDWVPAPEEEIDADWLRREHERLRLLEEASDRTAGDEETVNGSTRQRDGRFASPSERVYRTDGRATLASDEYEEILLRIAAQMKRARSVAPVLALEGAKALRRLCDELEYEAVALARGDGWPWRDIGEVLGVSESAAHRRFARDARPRKRRPKT